MKESPAASGIFGKPLLQALQIPYQFTVYSRQSGDLKGSATAVTDHLAKARSVALGDLHGSYRKLVENLAAAQFIAMPETVAHDFVDCSDALEGSLREDPFMESSDTVKRVREFNQKLQALIPEFKWIGGKRQLILIGDVLADRGPLDSLTLAIVDHLTEKDKHPERIIRIASNHDHQAFRRCTQQTSRIIRDAFLIPSLLRSAKLSETSQKELQELKNQYSRYLKASKLMYYNPRTGSLYTHAPVSREEIQTLERALMSLPHDALSRKWKLSCLLGKLSLPQYIKEVNKVYRRYAETCFSAKAWPGESHQEYEKLEEAFSQFLETRNEEKNLSKTDGLPFYQKGVKTFVHGHDHSKQEPSFELDPKKPKNYAIVRLDQNVRKGINVFQEVNVDINLPKNRNLLFVE